MMLNRTFIRMLVSRGFLPLVVIAPIGCSPPSATEGGFDSPNPASRLYAIENAARADDRQAIPDLVELLGSDDPAVRLMAISTLERMTGKTYGYQYFDSPERRAPAMKRWLQAVADNEFQASTGP